MRDYGILIGLFGLLVFGAYKLMMFFVRKKKSDVSPYLIFGIAVLICGALPIGFALYDILTPGGDLNGLFGQVMLMVFVPTILVFLIGDIVAWRKDVKKRQNVNAG